MDHKTWLLFVLDTIIMSINGIIAYPMHLYCKEEFNIGYGRHPIFRYYFDNTAQQCLQFIYFGHGGTLNNFKTLEECKSICENVITHDIQIMDNIMDRLAYSITCTFSNKVIKCVK